ncbi:MAG: ABC transporter ATP-binding protein [Minwuia sp.]|nr:ABC transporter ATP-binding protein [Minwuia sp.]
MTETPLLQLDRLTRSFPGIVANDQISLTVQQGSIHALLGENGAGKSTLVKTIYGSLRPDSGQMMLDGKPFAPANPAAARLAGVGMVFQHFSLFDAMTVAENIAVALPADLVDSDLTDRIRDVSASYGLVLDPFARVDQLSVGERQRVEIVRCLLQSPRLIIMDEPTSVLTPGEVGRLFTVLRKLRDEGRSILYISHKLREIRNLCSAATVLRRGKVVATCDPGQETPESLARMMIGNAVRHHIRKIQEPGAVRLSIDSLDLPAETEFGVSLKNVSLQVRSGEIVGIAGVAGNGQDELMAALIGERRCAESDTISMDGAPVGRLGPTRRRDMGMSFVPEERLGHGAAAAMSLTENTLISARGRRNLARRGLLDFGAATRFAREIVLAFNVATTAVTRHAGSLSGGNLQKFVIGREVLQGPTVLIAAQPTWGVDAKSAAEIHTALDQLARAGAAILIISQDLDELLSICDRFAVLANGHLSDVRTSADVTVAEIGLLMGGPTGDSAKDGDREDAA